MAISDLKNVLALFGGSDINEAKQQELYKEALLMTLARAANADVSIRDAEVERVQAILKEHTGEDFSSADIRVAAREELYAEATLVKYLSSVRKKLSDAQCTHIVHALADVFRSDESVSVLEIDFFNSVAKSLGATPAQIAGLTAGDVVD